MPVLLQIAEPAGFKDRKKVKQQGQSANGDLRADCHSPVTAAKRRRKGSMYDGIVHGASITDFFGRASGPAEPLFDNVHASMCSLPPPCLTLGAVHFAPHCLTV